jgi:hypothetical protein
MMSWSVRSSATPSSDNSKATFDATSSSSLALRKFKFDRKFDRRVGRREREGDRRKLEEGRGARWKRRKRKSVRGDFNVDFAIVGIRGYCFVG